MKKHIPNFITCLNLISGCIAITFAYKNDLNTASLLILLSALFDFLDGMIARLLKSYSAIGKELDSLADVISFGLVPGTIMYHLILTTLIEKQLPGSLAYVAFIIPVFSALRLAKFNIDTRQQVHFIGLPTPANALFIAAIPFILTQKTYLITDIFSNLYTLLLICLTMSLLLVVEIQLFSLKMKGFSFKENKFQFILLIASMILIIMFRFAAAPLILILYILLSIIAFKKKKDEIPSRD